MKDKTRRDIDLDDTVELPVIDNQDYNQKTKDPMRIVFPFVSKIGIFLAIIISLTLALRAFYISHYGINLFLLQNQTLILTGINGEGEIPSSFHPEKQALSSLKKELRNQERHRKDTRALRTLIQSIDCSSSIKDHLSNGTVIQYACKFDAQAAKEAKYNLKDTSRSYTVTGLSNITTIDPFEQLQIETSNTDGVEHITLHPEKTFTDLGIQYSYTVDSTSSLTVSISYDQQKLSKQGYRILNNQTSKEISYSHSSTMNASNSNVPYTEIFNTFIPSVEEELASCQSYAFGKEEINAYHPALKSYTIQQDGSIKVTYSIQNTYTDAFPQYYAFDISYTGHIVQSDDTTYQFFSDTIHACKYDGYGSNYTIIKKETE